MKIKVWLKWISFLIMLNLVGWGIYIVVPMGSEKVVSKMSGLSFDVPRQSTLKEEGCMFLSFYSDRSSFSLTQDFKQIFKNYDKVSCDGKSYYYHPQENFYIEQEQIKNHLVYREFTFAYGYGNPCQTSTCQFTKTYQILKQTPSNDPTMMYLTLTDFTGAEVQTVLVEQVLVNSVVENMAYEFTFQVDHVIGNHISDIFQMTELVNVTKTEKIGMDQINESPCYNK